MNTGDEEVLLCGGFKTDQVNSVSDACYIYNAILDTWTTNWTMNTPRACQGMSMYKGRVYVYGGENDRDGHTPDQDALESIEVLSYDY